jgi:hypothetical protein
MPENLFCSVIYMKKRRKYLYNIAEGISMAYVYAVWAYIYIGLCSEDEFHNFQLRSHTTVQVLCDYAWCFKLKP